MRLGLGSYAYRWSIGIGDRIPLRPLTPADLARRAHRYGLSVVQIADNLPLDRQSDIALDELESTARQLGVAIELGFSGLTSGRIHTYLDLAERLNARLIRAAPDAVDSRRASEAIVGEIIEVEPRLKSSGVQLAIENHFHLPSPKLRRIVEGVSSVSVGVCLDVANSIAVGEWPAETIRVLAPFAFNLHLKDYKIEIDPYGVGLAFAGAPLGAGLTDIAGALSAVEGRDCSVILEHWLPWVGSTEASATAEDEWLAIGVAAVRKVIG
jgi:sugar phosphate isomerase/epimerase